MAFGLWTVLATAAVWAGPGPGTPRSSSRRPEGLALVVGIDDYGSGWGNPGAEERAGRFAAFATQSLGIPASRVLARHGEQASKAALDQALAQLFVQADLEEWSSIWLYYGGYAGKDAAGKPALFGAEGDPAAAVPLEPLLRKLATTRADERVLVIDADWEDASELPKPPPGVVLLTYASGRSASREPLKRVSLTAHLINGMNGAADLDADGDITFAELGSYLRRKLEAAGDWPVLALGTQGAEVAVSSPRPVDPALPVPPLVVLSDGPPPPGPTGSIRVESSLRGSLVLDGALTAQSAPGMLEGVLPGIHEVRLQTGSRIESTRVRVDAGEVAEVRFPRDNMPLRHPVDVATRPAGAQLSVDGVPYGNSPEAIRLWPGDHVVHAELGGYQPLHVRFEVADETRSATFDLTPTDDSYVLSLLPPQAEYARRMKGDFWIGGRLGALFPTFDPTPANSAWNTAFVGLSVLLHYRIEDPAKTAIGMDLYGGPTAEYVGYNHNTSGPGVSSGSASDGFYGAVVGLAIRIAWAQVAVETQTGITGSGEVHLFVAPLLAVRIDH